ncbi:hypothetical protein IFM89_005262 [Coptis chinensis]|uniref:Wall-associated receptor kinase galacturonan-binding domain-containing protein n=1 Tax=Coptis chinensis TaxID=261450 RepID=A0A835M903_9MAGN|nr:hypothetical protein IFM89_005262 [Coptis chinensis]
MEHFPLFFTLQLMILLLLSHYRIIVIAAIIEEAASCQNKCGSLQVNYPLGTGSGCGSPLFNPYVSCAGGGDKLLLTTHTGSYPITSISYSTSSLTITPPSMSTCNSMQSSPNFGLDWPSPFQLGPSTFILLSCPPPTSSLTIKGTPICDDTVNSHLCGLIHTCPAMVSLGLSIFAPTNTCCVYSPANLNSMGDLDLKSLKCASYVSVVSLGDVPTDPSSWVYGITLKYNQVGVDNSNIATRCEACRKSDGICGYAPPRNNFLCVCKSGVNSSTDCYNQLPAPFWSSNSFRLIRSSDYHYVYVLLVVLISFV